jgi:hypothetical protein
MATMMLDRFLWLVFMLAVTVNTYQPLKGVTVQCAKESSRQVDIGDWLSDSVEKPAWSSLARMQPTLTPLSTDSVSDTTGPSCKKKSGCISVPFYSTAGLRLPKHWPNRWTCPTISKFGRIILDKQVAGLAYVGDGYPKIKKSILTGSFLQCNRGVWEHGEF